MLNRKFEVYSTGVGIRVFAEVGEEIAVTFSDSPVGHAAFSAVKEAIAKAGGSLLNLDTGEYDVGCIGEMIA